MSTGGDAEDEDGSMLSGWKAVEARKDRLVSGSVVRWKEKSVRSSSGRLPGSWASLSTGGADQAQTTAGVRSLHAVAQSSPRSFILQRSLLWPDALQSDSEWGHDSHRLGGQWPGSGSNPLKWVEVKDVGTPGWEVPEERARPRDNYGAGGE